MRHALSPLVPWKESPQVCFVREESFLHQERQTVSDGKSDVFEYVLAKSCMQADVSLAFLLEEHVAYACDVVVRLEGVRQRVNLHVKVVAREGSSANIRALVMTSSGGHVVHQEIRGLISGKGGSISCLPEVLVEREESLVTHAVSLIPLQDCGYSYLCARGYSNVCAREALEVGFLQHTTV